MTGAERAEPVERLEHLDELLALVGQHLSPWDGLEGGGDVLLLGREPRGEPVDAVDGPDDLPLLFLQAADEGVQLSDEVLDLGLVAAQGVVELGLDDLEPGPRHRR